MSTSILYVGSPLLDISCVVDSQYLQKYKLKSNDCVRSKQDELHKKLFAEVFSNPTSTFTAGGSAQNSARVSKWVLRDDPHSRVWFAGCVGNDDYAKALETILKEDGVIACYARHENLSTGICICLLTNEGESQRSMCTDLGAAADYSVQHIDQPVTQTAMEEADLMFVVGFFLSHSPEVVLRVAHYCHTENKYFAVSLSAPYICEAHFDDLLSCFLFVDILFGNYEEAKVFLQKIEPEECTDVDIASCAKTLANYPKVGEKPRIVVISNGAEPVVICHTHGLPEEHAIPKVEDIVDTVGCGDALAGGFLASYAMTKCSKTAVQCGIQCATKVAKVKGCTMRF